MYSKAMKDIQNILIKPILGDSYYDLDMGYGCYLEAFKDIKREFDHKKDCIIVLSTTLIVSLLVNVLQLFL